MTRTNKTVQVNKMERLELENEMRHLQYMTYHGPIRNIPALQRRVREIKKILEKVD